MAAITKQPARGEEGEKKKANWVRKLAQSGWTVPNNLNICVHTIVNSLLLSCFEIAQDIIQYSSLPPSPLPFHSSKRERESGEIEEEL